MLFSSLFFFLALQASLPTTLTTLQCTAVDRAERGLLHNHINQRHIKQIKDPVLLNMLTSVGGVRACVCVSVVGGSFAVTAQ